MKSSIALIIPAYQPGDNLPGLVASLRALTNDPILVVDDGSDLSKSEIFDRIAEIPKVLVLRHAVNLGKGAALKTAFNEVLLRYPNVAGVVTVDADGQHLVEDVLQVAQSLVEHPESFHLGTREFKGAIPFRSQLGNVLTRAVFRIMTGTPIRDTQTGLRGIPASLLPQLLKIRASRYDFEMDMLMLAIERRVQIHQVPIQTVYEPGNPTSHFNPLLDSARIYFVFLRFSALSLLTAAIDFVVFSFAFSTGGSILRSTILGRVFAGTFNFVASRKLVFHSSGRWKFELVKYATLVTLLMVVSSNLIQALNQVRGIPVLLAKVLAESALFVASFAIQRIFVFHSDPAGAPASATDWDAYYEKPFPATSVTRRITERRLLQAMSSALPSSSPEILELGGANSCFYDAINRELNPKVYRIVDNNRRGLDKFKLTYPEARNVHLLEQDVLNWEHPGPGADLCFSAGLIEHFSIEGTAAAIRAHFKAVRPGGAVVITFPTPTFLYRITRALAEAFGLWAFPDERPLHFDEILPEIERHGEVLHQSVIWPIILTQGLVVARARTPQGHEHGLG